MKKSLLALICVALSTLGLHAHVIQELYAEVSQHKGELQVDFLLDAMDEIDRGNADSDPPPRDWLFTLTDSQHAALRIGSSEYITGFFLATDENGARLPYSVTFPDYDSNPPDFPIARTGIATVTVRIMIPYPENGKIILTHTDKNLPDLAIKVLNPGDDRYVNLFAAGKSETFTLQAQDSPDALVKDTTTAEGASSPWKFFLHQGFSHVIPEGWDHILFMIALALLTLEWRKLIEQSLLFTAAHSLTLGLTILGVIALPSGFIEAVIALSIAWMAAENLWAKKIKPTRLILIGVFGLVHGMGFAYALGSIIRDSDSFISALFFTNLGVELAQICVIMALWLIFKLFIPKKFHAPTQKALSAIIVIVASILFITRVI